MPLLCFNNCCSFFLSVILLFATQAKAQYEEKNFIHYSVKQGLGENYITCLQQDKQGYLWIGTDAGLNRFDGYSFKNFHEGTESLPLPSNNIRKLKPFGKDKTGILSYNGFQLLNSMDLSFHNYTIADSTAFGTQLNAVWDAVQLPNQSFAVTTASGFHVFKSDGKIDFRYDAYTLKDIGKKRIFFGRNIFTLNDKEYLIYAEETGLAYYNAEKKLFRIIDPQEKEWKAFSHPSTIADDHWVVKEQLNNHQFVFIPYKSDSIIFYDYTEKKRIASALAFHPSIEFSWESRTEILNDSVFAINGGTYGFYLFRLDKQTGHIITDGKKLMPSYKITCIFFDNEKRLWLGTNEGLLQQKLTNPLINAYKFSPSNGETLTGGLKCTYRYKNKLYAGRYSLYKGLIVINPVTMLPEKEIEFYGGNNGWNEILSMEMYHPDTLWIGTNAGLLWFDTKTEHYGKVLNEKKYTGLNWQPVILAPARKDGYAWFCYQLEGVVGRYHIASRSFTFFTPKTEPALPFSKVKSIAYDSYGDVWIGGHSLARWNNRLQLFDTLITVYGGTYKFNDDILTLSADENGSLWLHNAGNNLLEYRIKEKKFISYTVKDGIPAEDLQSFSPVVNDVLWIGSNNHLTKFNTHTKKSIVYDQSDGLPQFRPTSRKIYYDSDSNLLYMGCNEYLVRFPLLAVGTSSANNDLMMEEVVINNKQSIFNPEAEIKLPYNKNNITLNYTIIDFETTNYQFAYKINGADSWNILGQQHFINFTNLQPAKYIIQLKVTGKSGIEKIKIFTLIIQPPFWKTTWFYIAFGLLLAAAIFYLYRKRIRQVEEKANIDKLIAQTEMKALHSQMNPHFIFNSLNSIREMILNNENKEASHYLGKFAQLIRMTLDQSGQSFISLRNTIDYLHRYIEMEQTRNAYFTSHILADDDLDLDETILPPMLIQPFVENAIWHGVTADKKNININIHFKKQNNQLLCIIDDNGVGIDQSLKNKNGSKDFHNPIGIANVKDRIKLLNEKYNLQSCITIEDKKNKPVHAESGTLVTLFLPLEIKEE